MGGEGVLEAAFAEAGFQDIQAKVIDAPVRVSSATECLQFEKESFGALHQMLGGLSESEKDEAWSEIETSLKTYEGDDGFCGPCEMVVVVGTKA